MAETREDITWTTNPPTQAGWYWFQSDALNRAPRIVHVIETLGEWMVDDREFDLYDEVSRFAGAHWSSQPMKHPQPGEDGWLPPGLSDVEW